MDIRRDGETRAKKGPRKGKSRIATPVNDRRSPANESEIREKSPRPQNPRMQPKLVEATTRL
jgi:hypothetical protein